VVVAVAVRVAVVVDGGEGGGSHGHGCGGGVGGKGGGQGDHKGSGRGVVIFDLLLRCLHFVQTSIILTILLVSQLHPLQQWVFFLYTYYLS
jgi:hypothetical protein